MDVSSSSSHSTERREEYLTNRRKEMFGDCALIEIIHLHDCLRGALTALEADVNELAGFIVLTSDSLNDYGQVSTTRQPLSSSTSHQLKLADLERRVAGRFKVIWSVFKSHSQAEDEFIWPALKVKSQGEIHSSPKNSPKYEPEHDVDAVVAKKSNELTNNISSDINLEQEEYEEDHADEERMFSEMDTYLAKLHDVLLSDTSSDKQQAVNELVQFLRDHTRHLSQHLMAHLEKEETQCMPLVIKYLSKSEIHELVGQIMGKRSADTIAQIMTMAVQNLNDSDREEMVRYMKQSMAGTFFDRWLTMSGWNGFASKRDAAIDF
jgi:hypothetical protein